MNQTEKFQKVIMVGLCSLGLFMNIHLGCSSTPLTEQTKEVFPEFSQERMLERQIDEKKPLEPKTEPKATSSEEVTGDAGSDRKFQEEPILEALLEQKDETLKAETSTKEQTKPEQIKEQEPEVIHEKTYREQVSEVIHEKTNREQVSEVTQQENAPPKPKCSLASKPGEKYTVGTSYYGRNRYIKYVAGSLPIILSSPHGGTLKPKEIKTRTYGVRGQDSYSLAYTYEVARRLYQLTGRLPHIVTNRLHRSKLDANREIKEASQGDKNSEQAWKDFKSFILSSRKWVTQHCKRGHYFDLHTNAHKQNWTEFGVLLGAKDLAKTNAALDTGTLFKHRSSWKTLTGLPNIQFSERLRGSRSLGSLLMTRGYKSIPSIKHPNTRGHDYFKGGHNTAQYGSRLGGAIDGTQIESHLSMISNTKRFKYSQALAESLLTFVEESYGFTLRKKTKTLAHSRCVKAKNLTLKQGQIDFYDQTWGALAEFFGKLHCGTKVKLNGAQLFYRIKLQANKRYTFSLTADFPARFYLFGETCDVSEINKQCKASGINGILTATGIEKKMTFQPKKSGWFRFAVGSRYLHWIGRFRLKIL